ncbi:MAG TPA: response regulator [Clostridiales bacterium]|nr:response regulator [Clostridiales bacterium]
MIKILVADDELLARKAIINILQHSDIELEIMGEFDSGEAVITYLEETEGSADILITDIRMLDMDGLQVARLIRERGWDTQVILISGYAEFAYAQQAIQYRVEQYLTKPLDQQKLLDAVVHVIQYQEELATNRTRQVEQKLLEFSMEQLSLQDILRNRKLNERLAGFAPRESAWQNFRVVVLQIDSHDEKKQEIMQSLLRQQAVSPLQLALFYFSVNREWVLTLFGTREELSDKRVSGLMEELFSRIRRLGTIQASAGVSEISTGFQQLYTAYKAAISAINFRLLKGWNAIYYVFPVGSTLSVDLLTEGQRLGIKQALLKWDADKAKRIIHSFFSDKRLLQQQDVRPLYNGIVGILSIINEINQVSIGDDINAKAEMSIFTRYNDLYRFYTIYEMEAFIDDVLENMCAGRSSLAQKTGGIVSRIKEYVKSNYQDPISLQELANQQLFMNTSYLSRLFKVTTGHTFSQYLVAFRMEKAMDLLENSTLNINEIAEHVGFNDTSHFIQCFRKHFHTTPKEYRIQTHQNL